jgi:hypothetical protein
MKTIQRLFVAVLATVALPAAASDAIAFITNLKGEVAVDGNSRPLLLSELAKGQKIAVGRESLVSVMYIATGKEYVLKGPADYHVHAVEISGSTPMPPTVRSTDWRASNKVLVQVAQTFGRQRAHALACEAEGGSLAQAAFPDRGQHRHAPAHLPLAR